MGDWTWVLVPDILWSTYDGGMRIRFPDVRDLVAQRCGKGRYFTENIGRLG